MTLLLYGKERLLKDEALADLKAKTFKSPSELDLNFQSFDAERHSVASVTDFLSTAPFLAAKRLAVLWHVEALDEEDAEKLAAAIEQLPSTATLVLETEETNTKRNTAVRALAGNSQATACHTPFERDLPGWIENRSKKKGVALERGVASFLAGQAGPDLASLDQALEALRLYTHPRVSATLADARAVAPSNPEQDVFKLAELLLEDRKKEALGVVDGLYRSGSRAPEIVAALAGQLERYKRASASLATGRAPFEVGEEMKVPRIHQPAFFQRLKRSSIARLQRLQKALLECDESFKTGRADERLSVERFILSS